MSRSKDLIDFIGKSLELARLARNENVGLMPYAEQVRKLGVPLLEQLEYEQTPCGRPDHEAFRGDPLESRVPQT